MVNEKQVKKRLHVLLYRLYESRVKAFLTPKPSNCIYNSKFGKPGSSAVGICLYDITPDSAVATVCNTREHCASCSAFTPAIVKYNLKEQILEEIISDDSEKYSRIKALLWVLQSPQEQLNTYISYKSILVFLRTNFTVLIKKLMAKLGKPNKGK